MEKLMRVLWDEHFTFRGRNYTWHVKYWELLLLGGAACAVLYGGMVLAACLVTY